MKSVPNTTFKLTGDSRGLYVRTFYSQISCELDNRTAESTPHLSRHNSILYIYIYFSTLLSIVYNDTSSFLYTKLAFQLRHGDMARALDTWTFLTRSELPLSTLHENNLLRNTTAHTRVREKGHATRIVRSSARALNNNQVHVPHSVYVQRTVVRAKRHLPV